MRILACCLFPLKDGGAGTEAYMKKLQKADAPYLSLTKTGTVVLVISLAAGILLISF
jgi:hypothetical protein